MDSTACPLCQQPPREPHYQDGWFTHVECNRCGRWKASDSVLPKVAALGEEQRFWLTVEARQRSELGQPLKLEHHNLDEVIRGHQPFTLQKKRRSILDYVRLRSENQFGRRVQVYPDLEYPLFGCRPRGETENVISSLTHADDGHLYSEPGGQGFSLTVKGWEATDPASGGAVPGTCFVAMKFGDAQLEQAYEKGIVPAAEDAACGLNVIRVDRQQSNDKIDDRIINGLRRAEVTVAEVTDPNAGAYFEAGFALALGRQVIFCCKDVAFEGGKGVHFDTRMYPYIVWKTPEDLREQLVARMLNTVPSLIAKRQKQ